MGELDCNGDSPMHRPLQLSMNCTDIRGFAGESNANTWGGRFYDNGEYLGHDEPDMTFLSGQSGSGNDVTWVERIPYDPSEMPIANHPGHDVNHWFELSPAPWLSMAMCDPNSYPRTPCRPESDSNAPAANCLGAVRCTTGIGGGSAFMEMQLCPPGQPEQSPARVTRRRGALLRLARSIRLPDERHAAFVRQQRQRGPVERVTGLLGIREDWMYQGYAARAAALCRAELGAAVGRQRGSVTGEVAGEPLRL